MSNYRTLRTELNVWLGAAVKQQDELQTSHTHDSHMLSQQLTRQKDLILDLDKHRAKLDECQRYSTEYYTRVKDYELQLMAYWTMVEKTPPKKKLLTSSADATNEEIMELRNRHSSQLSQAQEHEKFIEETLQRVQEEEMSLEKSRETHLDKVNGLLEWVGSMVPSSVKERANFMDLDNNTLKVTCSQQEVRYQQIV
uniref:Uncharacterized protein n=1 Tax=Eptatretus burgeri TaxID=7764 RepID=A0A8C4WX59_EPTBU